jgi:hypothetical protein
MMMILIFASRKREKPQKVRKDSQPSGRELNPGPPGYEAGMVYVKNKYYEAHNVISSISFTVAL